MLLDIEPKYGSYNETYLGEGEGSAGAPRCCVTPYFLFKNCRKFGGEQLPNAFPVATGLTVCDLFSGPHIRSSVECFVNVIVQNVN